MLESNSQEPEKIVDPNLNKKGGNGFLIFLIILYTLIAAFVTYYNIRTNEYYQMGLIDYFKKYGTVPQFDILYKEPDKATNEVIEKNNSTKTIAVKKNSTRDRYFLNNLEYESTEENYGSEVLIDSPYSSEYYSKGTVRYAQISGLKDKDMESRINTLLKNKALEKMYKYLDDPNVMRVDVDTYVYGNFSNLLSIEVFTSLTLPDKDEYGYHLYDSDVEYFNFRLDTGEQIKFKDLFVEGTSIKSILSQAIYRELAWNYMAVDDEFNEDLTNTDYSEIETKVFVALSGLTQEDLENLDYCFTNIYILAMVKDRVFRISYSDIFEYLNICNIAKTRESVFEGGNLPQRDFVYTPPILNTATTYDKIGNNILLIIYNNSDDQYKDSDGRDIALENFVEKEVIPYVKENSSPDKGYIYSINASHYINYSEGGDRLGLSGEALIMDINDYNAETVEDALYCSIMGFSDEMDGIGSVTFDRLIYLPKDELEADLPALELYTISDYDGEYQEGEKIGNYYWEKVEYDYIEEDMRSTTPISTEEASEN